MDIGHQMVQGPGDEGRPDAASCDILVVDDNASNLMAMEAVLGAVGGRIVPAHSGQEALRLLLEGDFALILLDVQMPLLDGLETARLIRRRPKSRHTPIIFVTAHGRDDEEVREAYKLGAVDFLFKPVVAEILQSKASVFVELHRRTQQVAHQLVELRAHRRREIERTLEQERRRWEEEALRRQMAQLAENDRRKDEFLAVLGHELRNPLSAIVVGCELLRRKFADRPELDQATRSARDRIDRQTQHLRILVDDLLDLARINSGKMRLKKSLTTIQQVVEQAVATTSPIIEERGHSLVVEVPPDKVTLWADPVRLAQVIANLLSNAARYTDPGGAILLKITLRGEPGLLDVEVSDNGRGIPPEMLPHVFDAFVQANLNLHDPRNGLGLGLTIVKRLVAMHDGTVAASSGGVGKGSTFSFTLPLDTQAGETELSGPHEAVTPAPTGSGLSVVLVEDNGDIRDSMIELLTDLGHTVRAAGDGRQGADLILEVGPDVAIVDVGLPTLDGYEVAAAVRSRVGRAVRLVAMTGHGRDADRVRAREAGFDAYLVKPANLDALIGVLGAKDTSWKSP